MLGKGRVGKGAELEKGRSVWHSFHPFVRRGNLYSPSTQLWDISLDGHIIQDLPSIGSNSQVENSFFRIGNISTTTVALYEVEINNVAKIGFVFSEALNMLSCHGTNLQK